jgi:two-component system nitrate/nitrite response regulator NarL
MVAVNPRPYATVLIGPHTLFAEGIARILDNTEFQVTARAADADRLASDDLKQHKTVLFVLDASHGVAGAVRQVEALRRLHAEARIVAFTRAMRTADMALLFQASANACFAEDVPVATFLKSLELVMLGETLVPSTMLFEAHRTEAKRPERLAPGRLSSQETRILENLVEGLSNKTIARKLGSAEATIKVHVKSILRKLGLTNRTQAAIWAMRSRAHRSSMDDNSPAEGKPSPHDANAPARDPAHEE